LEENFDREREVKAEKKPNRCMNPKKCCCCINIDTGVHLINIIVIATAVFTVSTYRFTANPLKPLYLFFYSISIFIYCIFLCDKQNKKKRELMYVAFMLSYTVVLFISQIVGIYVGFYL